MTSDSLPVKLRQARGAMGLSEAASRIGVSEERIRMYEEGTRRPYGKTLTRMAEVYGIPAAELAGFDTGGRSLRDGTAGPRRRRRRRRVQEDMGAERVEVPLEVGEGQVVRVVIELIIRPKAPVHAIEPSIDSRPHAIEPTPPPSGDGRAVEADLIPAGSSGNGSPRFSAPRDPLSDMRRAYGEFRRDRR